MIEATGDIFDADADAVCVTTNGFVKVNGGAVMGRGCAKQLADYFPKVKAVLGFHLRQEGNIPHWLLNHNDIDVWSFPVKPAKVKALPDKSNVVRHWRNKCVVGGYVPGFAAVADL